MEGIRYTGIPYIIYPNVNWKDVDYEIKDGTKPFAPIELVHVPPRNNLALFAKNFYNTNDDPLKHFNLIDAYTAAKHNPNVVNPADDGYGYHADHNGHRWDYSDILGLNPNYEMFMADIHRVDEDDYYIFGEDFYNQVFDNRHRSNMSKLECVVTVMLLRKKLDNELLLWFCETYHSWGALEKFYLIPILLMAIRYAIRSK